VAGTGLIDGKGTMGEPGASDPFETAATTVRLASERGVPLRLIGGQAIRLLTPDFPPRVRSGQDMDFASVSSAKRAVMEFLSDQGFQGDKRFNTIHGHKQMYFTTPEGATSVDVVMDQLNMCHVLTFKDRIARMPYTLDVTDLLMSKLQVVEQNEKDVQDITYLLAAFPVTDGDEPGTIGAFRFCQIVGDDWGWWRTVTRNLERVAELVRGELRDLVPANARFDPVEQAGTLRERAEAAPKSLRWKLRSKVGERVQWYELPEEIAH
jgi:hypothetical protein